MLPLPARVKNIPAQVRKHCKTISTAAVTQAVPVLKSHYPEIDYTTINDGYAADDTEEANKFYSKAEPLV